MVLVVRQDCEQCRKLLEKHFADPHAHRPNERTAVFVAGATSWPFMLDKIAIESSSNTSITWLGEEPFVASPAIFLIENGRVDPLLLTTHRFQFDQIERGFTMMQTKEDGMIKPLISFT